MKLNKTAIVFILFVTAIGFSQCKKKAAMPKEFVDPTAASFANIQTHIFKHSCNSSGCHSTGAVNNTQHGLVLEGVDVYERLINKDVKNSSAKNLGLKLVIPNKADSSFLLTKCQWTSFKFGSQMPLGKDPITAGEIEFIRQWINAGAPKTGVVADHTLIKPH